jgi:hypothetical protein
MNDRGQGRSMLCVRSIPNPRAGRMLDTYDGES